MRAIKILKLKKCNHLRTSQQSKPRLSLKPLLRARLKTTRKKIIKMIIKK